MDVTAEEKEEIRLSAFSRSSGCGCKISPEILHQILENKYTFPDKNLLVGNDSKDDAAVYDLQNGTALISTTDFFTPIVDDAFYFGKIAAANAISDVYAMGGKPVLAISILGWPTEKLPASLAARVIEGAESVCAEAGIPLAGGHTIDSTEPFFGLSVNGIVQTANLKRNNTALEGDVLFLTKPIGVGILATAQKRNVITPEHLEILLGQLSALNSVGEKLGSLAGVTAMTDVTGFGLAGHLIEMAEGSGLSAEISYSNTPLISNLGQYISKRVVPDATYRNWNSYHKKVDFEAGVDVMEAFSTMPDPQTNGGLLIAVNPAYVESVVELLTADGFGDFTTPVGRMIAKKDKVIYIKK